MNKVPRIIVLIVSTLILGITSVVLANGPGGSTVIVSAQGEGQLNTFLHAVNVAGLADMYNGYGPFTVFAPTDAAFAALPAEVQNELWQNPNRMRQVLLYHTLQGDYLADNVAAQGSMATGLGPNVTVRNQGGAIIVNDGATVIVKDIFATNGKINVIDAVLNPDGGVYGGWGGGSGGGDSAAPAPRLDDPNQNPAYVGGGTIPYHAGVSRESSVCKGMTWTLLQQMDGIAKVGSDRYTNPYRGDTECTKSRPILCINRDHSQPPTADYAYQWGHGQVQLTGYVVGTQLTSKATADGICQQNFGAGWRMAEFHDGGMGMYPASSSGWAFWAYGGLPIGQRFWVSINDQPGNPWNSVQQRWGPNYSSDRVVTDPSQSPQYSGPMRSQHAQRAEGRPWCKGMTWVVLEQGNGLVKVGADAMTNAFHGDRSCPETYPVLCMKVDALGVPASGASNYAEGWSGGHVALSHPVTGTQLNTRENANNVCKNQFGTGWRMAEFHDGCLGTANTDGWRFWAYGNLEIGRRFWVAINDQHANPWNP